MVLLNKFFYSIDSIEKSKIAFKDVCNVSVREKEGSFELLFSLINKSEPLRVVELEFCNYCLGMMK